MIDVSSSDFDLAKVDLGAISYADIAPKRVGRETEEETAARETLFRAAARNKVRDEAASERARVDAALKVRCDAIHALTPKGAEQLSYAAMRDGTSVERFEEIIADWRQQQAAAAHEAAAQAILSTFHLFLDQNGA